MVKDEETIVMVVVVVIVVVVRCVSVSHRGTHSDGCVKTYEGETGRLLRGMFQDNEGTFQYH